MPLIDQTSSLPVATSPPHVRTTGKVLSVETNTDGRVNVETDNGLVHVETQENDQSPWHVQTTADQTVMLHVHVETPDIVNPNTVSVEPADTQIPVQKPTDEKQQAMLPVKTAKLILKPINELEIDVWWNKTSDYYRFMLPTDSSETSNNTEYSLHARKPKVTPNGFSLRKTNNMNYAPMLNSDTDNSDGV